MLMTVIVDVIYSNKDVGVEIMVNYFFIFYFSNVRHLPTFTTNCRMSEYLGKSRSCADVLLCV